MAVLLAMLPVYFVPSAPYAVTPFNILFPLSNVASLVSVNFALPVVPLFGIRIYGTFE